MPRGRWYLKLRPSIRTPLAQSALLMQSPAKPAYDLPSNVKLTCLPRSIHSPG